MYVNKNTTLLTVHLRLPWDYACSPVCKPQNPKYLEEFPEIWESESPNHQGIMHFRLHLSKQDEYSKSQRPWTRIMHLCDHSPLLSIVSVDWSRYCANNLSKPQRRMKPHVSQALFWRSKRPTLSCNLVGFTHLRLAISLVAAEHAGTCSGHFNAGVHSLYKTINEFL